MHSIIGFWKVILLSLFIVSFLPRFKTYQEDNNSNFIKSVNPFNFKREDHFQSIEISALFDYKTGIVFYKDESLETCFLEDFGTNEFDFERTLFIPENGEMYKQNHSKSYLTSGNSSIAKEFCGNYSISLIVVTSTTTLKSINFDNDGSDNKTNLPTNFYLRKKRSVGSGQHWPQQGGASQSQIQGQVSGQGYFSGQAQSQLGGASQSQVQLSGLGIVGSVSSSAGNAQTQIVLAQGTGSGQASSLGQGPSNSQVQVNLGEQGRGSLASASVLAGQDSGYRSDGWIPGSGYSSNGQREGTYRVPQELVRSPGKNTYQGVNGYISGGGHQPQSSTPLQPGYPGHQAYPSLAQTESIDASRLGQNSLHSQGRSIQQIGYGQKKSPNLFGSGQQADTYLPLDQQRDYRQPSLDSIGSREPALTHYSNGLGTRQQTATQIGSGGLSFGAGQLGDNSQAQVHPHTRSQDSSSLSSPQSRPYQETQPIPYRYQQVHHRNGYRRDSEGSSTQQYPSYGAGSQLHGTGGLPQAFASSVGGGQAQAQTVYLGRGTLDFYNPNRELTYGSSNGGNSAGRSQTQYASYDSSSQTGNGGHSNRVTPNGYYRTNGNGAYRQTYPNGNGYQPTSSNGYGSLPSSQVNNIGYSSQQGYVPINPQIITENDSGHTRQETTGIRQPFDTTTASISQPPQRFDTNYQQGAYQPIDNSQLNQYSQQSQQPSRTTGTPVTVLTPRQNQAPSYGVSQVSPNDPSTKRCTIITFYCTILIESNGRAKICRPNVENRNDGSQGQSSTEGYRHVGANKQTICCC